MDKLAQFLKRKRKQIENPFDDENGAENGRTPAVANSEQNALVARNPPRPPLSTLSPTAPRTNVSPKDSPPSKRPRVALYVASKSEPRAHRPYTGRQSCNIPCSTCTERDAAERGCSERYCSERSDYQSVCQRRIVPCSADNSTIDGCHITRPRLEALGGSTR